MSGPAKASAKQKSQEDARTLALWNAGDFVEDVDRVRSIINLMNEALSVDVKEAKEESDKVEAWVPEVFAANIEWLFEQLERKIGPLYGQLREVGIPMGERV